MRVLVVAPYLATSDERTRHTMTLVSALEGAGAVVDVVDRRPASGRFRSRTASAEIAAHTWRRRGDYDAIVVVADAILEQPGGRLGRAGHAATCVAWTAVLRTLPTARLFAEHVAAGGRITAMLWHAARRIATPTAANADRLVAAGAPASRVHTPSTQPAMTPWDEGWDAAVDQQSAMTLIRTRAARDRDAVRGAMQEFVDTLV